MKLIDMKLIDFINEIDSKSPAPGGGSVAALSAALGVSLARMVGHLTVDKKKFLALSPDIQLEFKDTCDSLIMMKDQLVSLIDLDTESFNLIVKAFKMPKITEEEIKARNEKIQEGTLEAIIVPIKVASLSLSAMHQIPYILKYGNKQTISDLGVSTLMLSSGIDGACMNVLINLPGLEDRIATNQFKKQVDDLINKSHQIRDEILDIVYKELNRN
ncbi:MAG: formimidoyltetrahydrofolate cyclodeaminase [Tenericutes bacterium HGW-Tenericutes-2]|jgi:formiminotetrahydrofolate cyclodeaminase|nr:MAG: formimidoyltetrahydrofolate cyclodeaminase [Tenericutes bacterium HGW-Tenericutes-2]